MNSKKKASKITNSTCINKAATIFENLLNENEKIIQFLYRAQEFTKKVYNKYK